MKKSRFTRLAAIVLAAATLWITAVTAGADSLRSAIAAVRDSARLPVALLRWELGDTFPMDALALPAMLALRESPLLLSAWAEVSSLPASDDAAPVSEPATSRKEPEETPQPSLPDAPQDDADNGAASQTIAPTSPSGFVQVGDVFIKNNSTKALDPAWFDGSFAAALSDDAPQVLIVHTHGSEAYTMPKGQEYAPTGTCRTADNSVNMIRVGDEIAAVLSSYGISVLHDRVLYDDPAYDGPTSGRRMPSAAIWKNIPRCPSCWMSTATPSRIRRATSTRSLPARTPAAPRSALSWAATTTTGWKM